MSKRCFSDPVYAELFSQPALVRSLLQGFASSSIVEELRLSTLRRYPGHFLHDDHLDVLSDIVWQADLDKGGFCLVAILLSLQDSMEPLLMELQAMSLASNLWEDLVQNGTLHRNDKMPLTLPLVLYNGTEPWDVHKGFLGDWVPPSLQDCYPERLYFVLDVPRLTVPQLAQNRSLASLFFLLERARDPDWIQQLASEVTPILQEEHCQTVRRPFAQWLDRIVCTRAHCRGQLPAVQHLLEADRPEAFPADWKNRYIEQGRREGREEGRLHAGKLTHRLGSAPETVKMSVKSLADPDMLGTLFHAVYRADELQDFEKALERACGTNIRENRDSVPSRSEPGDGKAALSGERSDDQAAKEKGPMPSVPGALPGTYTEQDGSGRHSLTRLSCTQATQERQVTDALREEEQAESLRLQAVAIGFREGFFEGYMETFKKEFDSQYKDLFMRFMQPDSVPKHDYMTEILYNRILENALYKVIHTSCTDILEKCCKESFERKYNRNFDEL